MDNYFNVENINKYVPSETLILGLALKQIHFKEFLEQPLPRLSNLTLEQILTARRFISSMMIEIEKHIPKLDPISSSQDLLKYSPIFSQNNLVNLISSAFQLTSEQAIKIIELLTFKEKSNDDLWHRPLIKVNEEQLTVIFASLKSTNSLRCGDLPL